MENNIYQYQNERNDIIRDLGPVSTLQFQQYVIEKVKPAFKNTFIYTKIITVVLQA